MPVDEQVVDGWIEVDVIEVKESLALVKLPQSTLESGPYLTVRLGQLDIPKASPSPTAPVT
jgi:hypothetical protein